MFWERSILNKVRTESKHPPCVCLQFQRFKIQMSPCGAKILTVFKRDEYWTNFCLYLFGIRDNLSINQEFITSTIFCTILAPNSITSPWIDSCSSHKGRKRSPRPTQIEPEFLLHYVLLSSLRVGCGDSDRDR